MMENRDAFDLWWEWAEKPLDSPLRIPAGIHQATLSSEERRDRTRVNEAVRAAPEVIE
jgi:hypothetical protein